MREAVLNKPGPLTEAEYAHMMSTGHRLAAARRRSSARCRIALGVVRSHHERFDGSGIPDGLAGEEIPFEARIAAVADSFDAMTSQRPYRNGLSMDAARAELRRCRGTQYDPTVVDAFEEAVSAGHISLD